MTRLDQIRELEPGSRAVSVRHVPQSLDVFTTHFPLFPVLPGVLILEDLVAVARLALGEVGVTDSGRPWALSSVRRVRFRHFVQPGDSMVISVEVTGGDGETAVCRGDVRVDGRSVATVHEMVLQRHERGDSA